MKRRRFLTNVAATTAGVWGVPGLVRAANKNGKLRVLCVGVVGTIGKTDRRNVASHPEAEIVGLCDVDANYLAMAAKDHPEAFTCADYREAFEKYGDEFDAVVVATPDHTHASIILTALANDKHVYGQKPLVYGLAELNMIESAIKAKPHLVTLLGNQRMASVLRQLALEILKQGRLGKIKEIHAWTSAGISDNRYFNFSRVYRENKQIPENLNYDLWLGPHNKMPYYDEMIPEKWRSWWDFGTTGLGDWGCHLLDLPILAYPELVSPYSVKSECPEPPDEHFHAANIFATMKYKVDSPNFADKEVAVKYYQPSLRPKAEELGLPEWPGGQNSTAIVGEEGTLVVGPDGHSKLWMNGEWSNGARLEGLPKLSGFNHWHSWVDQCLGKDVQVLTPFSEAVKITEATIIGVKATRFPGQELLWDRSNLQFTNNQKATDTIVRREYRDGFAPPQVG